MKEHKAREVTSLDPSQFSRVLLINPPVADAGDADEKNQIACVAPIGILRIAEYLRRSGCQVDYIDCIRDPMLGGRLRRHVRKLLKCGNFEEEGISKEIYHYGLTMEELEQRMRELEPPDLVAVAANFTWSAAAAFDVLELARRVFPTARIIFGGNFVTLCPDEAADSAADEIFVGSLEGAEFVPTAIDLAPDGTGTDYLRMIKGCPYKCSYCVTNFLNHGKVTTRDPAEVLAELKDKMRTNGTRNFVFFDDFMLYKQKHFLDPFLDMVIEEQLDVILEFSLGFSAHIVTEEFASRMRRAGVETIVLALESIQEQRTRDMNRPHHIVEFIRAVDLLKRHGYKGKDLRSFFLMGLPGQTTREILTGILFLYNHGVTPVLTTYTVAPRTQDMEKYWDQIQGLALDELSPYLWRFASSEMKVRDLDATYRYFHERFIPVDRIRDSKTSDPIIRMMQDIIARGEHLLGEDNAAE